MHKPNIKYFFCSSQERFSRNRARSQHYKGRLQRSNVDLCFAKGDFENTDSIAGFFLNGVSEMMAEMYSKIISEQTISLIKNNK